jgi:hypothetical protein
MNRPLAIHGNVIHRQIYQNPLTKLYQERKKMTQNGQAGDVHLYVQLEMWQSNMKIWQK